MRKMTKFTEDLEKASMSAAKILRSDVTSDNGDRAYREMRQEADFVAETYHLLRSMNNKYQAEDFFLEYIYPKKVKMWNNERRLKPDLIYEGKDGDEVVEFKALWDGDIEGDSSKIKSARKGIISKYMTKLLAYRKLPNKIVSLTLVFAYLGPENMDNGQHFALNQFKDSIIDFIPDYGKLSKESKSELRVIVC